MASYILIKESHKNNLAEYAKTCIPNESCSILLGSKDAKSITIKEIVHTENIDSSPVEFSINPDQLFKTYEKAKKDGLDIVGVFHSHPTSEAKPSETDKKFMLINPGVWIIYSVRDDNFAAFGINSDKTVYNMDIQTN